MPDCQSAGVEGDAGVVPLLPLPAARANPTTAAEPKTIPTIGPGRWYQGFFAGAVLLAAGALVVPAPADVGPFANRTFMRVVPAVSTLTGAAS